MNHPSARSISIEIARELVEFPDAHGASSIASIVRAMGLSPRDVQNASGTRLITI